MSAHREIFTTISDLWDAQKPIDLITVTNALRDRGELKKVGGPGYITERATFVPTAANVGHYIEIVRDKYVQREGRRALDLAVLQIGAPDAQPFAAFEQLESKFASLRSLHGRNGERPVSIVALAETPPEVFEKDNLLGTRFLCVEGGMLFVGPSGIGKSSASIQQDILWALGRPAFGIKPARPLRILTIQAENDDGDLSEMSRGVCNHLNLPDEERNLVHERVIYIKEKALTGDAFLRLVRCVVRKYKPDIIRIDPLHAYGWRC
jgi:hypothetical protein